jgi:hypothetical protein
MSTLKVSNIQDISNNAAMSISGGVVTATSAIQAPGMVLQVVQNTSTTLATISSDSFVTTGFAATITPKFATSKLLLTVNVFITTVNGGQGSVNIYSSADSALVTSSTYGFGGFYAAGGSGSYESINSINFLTDPVGSTNSRTYTLYGKNTGTDPAYFLNGSRLSTFTITEIGA